MLFTLNSAANTAGPATPATKPTQRTMGVDVFDMEGLSGGHDYKR
jgi:hypothetical protein